MIGNHLMCQSALLNMYLVDQQNNFATKIVTNISKLVNKQSKSSQQTQECAHLNPPIIPNTPKEG